MNYRIKPIITGFLATMLVVALNAGESKMIQKEGILVKAATVEAACGQCLFGMKGDGCTLAVKIDGKPYFVEGTGIDDHGDAHAADGFCNAVKKAKVSGTIKDGKFIAESFALEKDALK